MKKTISLFILLGCLFQTALSQKVVLNPTPQSITFVSEKVISLSGSYQLIHDALCDRISIDYLSDLLKVNTNVAGTFKITLGIQGDKVIKNRYSKKIPQRSEGYYLSVSEKEIVLAGFDNRGLFYAIVTLSQLLKDNALPEVEIADYPDVRYRGVVEGFYGTPWSFDDRLRQIAFYGENKLNTYIYGPKDDPYHSSPNWRKPYPQEEGLRIKALVQASIANKVNFTWAIHPGKDIQWTNEDRDALLQKFESMYLLGVRSFAVFFDDISGIGTNAEKQAELLNYIDDNFIQTKNDVTPLIMCPTEYNKSWSNIEKGYLPTLGTKLNRTVEIMWTGDRVIATISKESLQWINQHIKRPAYIWWNFPVSDYVRNHLLMGKVYGNEKDINEQLVGFVTNPMERAEASKIAIYSVADYAWNLQHFDSDESWKNAIETLMPVSYKYLQVFCQHNSDLGPNGHKFRRAESEAIQPVVDSFLKDLVQNKVNSTEQQELYQEFNRIKQTADFLLASNDNDILINEIKPWIYQFKNLGETGLELFALIDAYHTNNTSCFINTYNYIKTLRKINHIIDSSFNQNPYQSGVKTGTLVLQPFIEQTFEYLVESFNKKNQNLSPLNSKLNYIPFTFNSNIAQIKGVPLQIKGKSMTIPTVLEVVKWESQGFITFNLDRLYNLAELVILIEGEDSLNWIQAETSANNIDWKKIDVKPGKQQLNGVNAKYIRIKNVAEEKNVKLKKISLVVE
ncbi:beta-N-acetylglucosaminidase [Bacteroides sp. 519]|uniref:beta-N-acetylglucosaminidase n=1 Tax=Bacteroides sp. 519 TaxID=2302937 RepID=UPI0019402AD3|nr:beta-N-acetylglucosaminidase [Bacteroides sp. 519]